MRRTICFRVICLLALIPVSCMPRHIPGGPYLGQKTPGSEPEVFASGFISLPDRRETKAVFSPDGMECFVQVGNHLFCTKKENGRWLKLRIPGFLGEGRGAEPFFSPDGERFLFVRDADIWMSVASSGQWSKPIRLAKPISTNAEEWHLTVTLDGTLYFCSSRDQAKGGYNIYCSKPEEGKYTAVERLGTAINSRYGAWDPFIAPDESYMIFSSDRPDGYGSVDQYIVYRNTDGGWGKPRNLGPVINTKAIEYGSYVSYDGRFFFFSRPEGWTPEDPADVSWVDSSVIFVHEN